MYKKLLTKQEERVMELFWASEFPLTSKDVLQRLSGWQAGLLTDSNHSDARVRSLEHGRIRQELDRGNTVVVTGFQGVDIHGDITTLGRGGSDTTAVALAAFLKADRCMIYTDVDGVYETPGCGALQRHRLRCDAEAGPGGGTGAARPLCGAGKAAPGSDPGPVLLPNRCRDDGQRSVKILPDSI